MPDPLVVQLYYGIDAMVDDPVLIGRNAVRLSERQGTPTIGGWVPYQTRERQSMAEVLPYVIANPGKTATDVANALGLVASSVSSHLHKMLLREKVIRLPRKGKRGGFGYYNMTPALKHLIETGGPSEEPEIAGSTKSSWQRLLEDD